MKKRRNTLAALIAMAMGSQHVKSVEEKEKKRPKLTKSQKEKMRLEKLRKLNNRRGLSEFFYGNNTLWALNQKNADRKAANKGWIQLEAQ